MSSTSHYELQRGCVTSETATSPSVSVNWGDPRLPNRFWDKVSPCPMSGCWLWTGGLHPQRSRTGAMPIPTLQVQDKLLGRRHISARRMAYTALISSLRGRTQLRPSCFVDVCVNPLHARVGALPLEDYKKGWKYKLNYQQLTEMRRRQGNRCAVCNEEFSPRKQRDKKGECIDHDHVTGAVRDLLCGGCNIGLGNFRDRPDLLRAAAAYIERHAKAGAP